MEFYVYNKSDDSIYFSARFRQLEIFISILQPSEYTGNIYTDFFLFQIVNLLTDIRNINIDTS